MFIDNLPLVNYFESYYYKNYYQLVYFLHVNFYYFFHIKFSISYQFFNDPIVFVQINLFFLCRLLSNLWEFIYLFHLFFKFYSINCFCLFIYRNFNLFHINIDLVFIYNF
jgi:hypothetical protein